MVSGRCLSSVTTSVETTMSPDGFLMTAASSPGPTTVDLERGLMMLLTVSTSCLSPTSFSDVMLSIP